MGADLFFNLRNVPDFNARTAAHILGKKPTEILMLTETNDEGVSYSVIARGGECGMGAAAFELGEADEVVWLRTVEFGHDRMHRAGGMAFVDAARTQERISRGLCRRVFDHEDAPQDDD